MTGGAYRSDFPQCPTCGCGTDLDTLAHELARDLWAADHPDLDKYAWHWVDSVGEDVRHAYLAKARVIVENGWRRVWPPPRQVKPHVPGIPAW